MAFLLYSFYYFSTMAISTFQELNKLSMAYHKDILLLKENMTKNIEYFREQKKTTRSFESDCWVLLISFVTQTN